MVDKKKLSCLVLNNSTEDLIRERHFLIKAPIQFPNINEINNEIEVIAEWGRFQNAVPREALPIRDYEEQIFEKMKLYAPSKTRKWGGLKRETSKADSYNFINLSEGRRSYFPEFHPRMHKHLVKHGF